MERNSETGTAPQRDMMYCHQCENEWYRDEHGLTCPECESDFAEIIEPDHDPREELDQTPPADEPQRSNEWDAPDPDEDDIGNVQWVRGDDGYMHGTQRIRRNVTLEWPPRPGQEGANNNAVGGAGGIFGSIGSMLSGVMNNAVRAAQEQQAQQRQVSRPENAGSPRSESGRPASAPPQDGNGMNLRHFGGPGFSVTISSGTFNGQPLHPRNANGPQPFQQQPDHLNHMMAQMLANIGAVPGGVGGGGVRGGGQFHAMGPNGMMADDEFFGGPGGGGLFQLFGPMFAGAMGGQFGDAVYSQEALDRIVTQLMERHQAGNAPGPATADAIRSLPKRTITKADQDANTGKADCSICMDEVPIGDEVTVLPCSHWFHFDCIEAWLKEHDTCPHCRQGIMPREQDQPDQRNRARDPSEAPLHDLRSPEYARPAEMPGGYPFPRQNSGGGDGTAGNPFSVPESPGLNRTRSNSDPNARPSADARRGSSGSGLFRSMREAFGAGRRNNTDTGTGPG